MTNLWKNLITTETPERICLPSSREKMKVANLFHFSLKTREAWAENDFQNTPGFFHLILKCLKAICKTLILISNKNGRIDLPV